MLRARLDLGQSRANEAAITPASHSAQTRRATDALQVLLDRYAESEQPIDVSFRQLVGPIPVNNLTHSIYPYPARLLRQIPRFLLHCNQLVKSGDIVLDPFCGSGTVLVEARAAQLTGWGIDINPFARLLSVVKTTPLDCDQAHQAAADILVRAQRFRAGLVPDVVNVDFWYSPKVKKALGRISRAVIESALPAELQRYLLVALALTAERCSLRDPRIPVPVRRSDWCKVASSQGSSEVWRTFATVSEFMAKRLATLPAPEGIISVFEGEDARQAHAIYRQHLAARLPQPAMVLTSPPYGAAQKYVRSCGLALGWTRLAAATELAALERGLIGREHLRMHELSGVKPPNSGIASLIASLESRDLTRSAIYAHYFGEMNAAIGNLASVLSPNGVLVLVAGSNTVAGCMVQTHYYLRDLAVAHGLLPILELRDTIRGRVLLTKRATTHIPLHYETIHILRKT